MKLQLPIRYNVCVRITINNNVFAFAPSNPNSRLICGGVASLRSGGWEPTRQEVSQPLNE